MPNHILNNENSNEHLINLCLLYLLGIIKDDTIPNKIQNLTNDDWNAIITKSAEHRVAPLLYYRLSNDIVDASIPDNVIQKLHRLYLHNSFINDQKFQKLSEFLKAFDKENIQVIILKGFAIGGLIYGNITLRPMGDIDLLVKSDDVLKIDSILSELGWTNKSLQLFAKSKKRLTGDIKYSNGSVFIDLHSRSHLMPKLEPWKEVPFVNINGTDIPMLKIDDFLLHLCLHLNEHICAGFSELIRLCDIIEMIKKYGDRLDWKYIENTAKINKADDVLYRMLQILDDIPSIRLPVDIGKSKKEGLPISLYDLLHIPHRKGNSAFKIALSPCLNSEILPIRYKLREILKLLFPNKSYMIERYTPKHPNLFYLYYPSRLMIGIMTLKSIKEENKEKCEKIH